MEKNKSSMKNLILAGGLALALGFTLELVKVPMEIEQAVPVEIHQYQENGYNVYNYKVPEGCNLRFDSKGNPVGYTMVESKVSLGDYVMSLVKK